LNFIVSNFYVYGVAIFMLIVTLVVQLTDWIPAKYGPGMGEEMCFLKSFPFSRLFYFYLVVFVMSIANIVFYVKTKGIIDERCEEHDEVTEDLIGQ
jgi:hypothetical protein